MQRVAIHLRDHATDLDEEFTSEIDVFARSAFNRFYYACYWSVRKNLPTIHPNWSNLGHKAIPEYLSKKCQSKIIDQLKTLRSKKVISEFEYQQIHHKVRQSIRQISNLMTEGYAIRCLADYSPESKATQSGNTLQLGNYKLSSLEKRYTEINASVLELKQCLNNINYV